MSLRRLTRRAPFIWFRTFAVGARAGAAAPLEPSRIIHRPPQLPMPLRRLLLQDDAPPLLGVLLERVLEDEGLAAVRAAVRLPRGVAGGHVPLHLLPRLGAVRALGARERPVAMAGDPVLLQLRLAAEAGAAHAALLAAAAVVHDAPVDHQLVSGARVRFPVVLSEANSHHFTF